MKDETNREGAWSIDKQSPRPRAAGFVTDERDEIAVSGPALCHRHSGGLSNDGRLLGLLHLAELRRPVILPRTSIYYSSTIRGKSRDARAASCGEKGNAPPKRGVFLMGKSYAGCLYFFFLSSFFLPSQQPIVILPKRSVAADLAASLELYIAPASESQMVSTLNSSPSVTGASPKVACGVSSPRTPERSRRPDRGAG